MMRTTRIYGISSVLLALAMAACGGDDEGGQKSNQLDCGEHGQLAGESCECEAGYLFDGNTCAPQNAPAECGGHGHLHGDKCHCDIGYEPSADESTCVLTEAPAECSGHGHLHGDHCHCDAGYETGETELECVPATEEPVECSGHGHLHGDHCHCDEGYEHGASELECVPATEEPVECSGHGHLHGDHCHCDAGYEPSADEKECLPAECGGFGSLVSGVCECDAGYELSGDTCVPQAAEECGGHGHLHGDHCDCDLGYVAVGLVCVPELPPSLTGYSITGIGYAGKRSFANSVNNKRQVVGNIVPATEPGDSSAKLLAYIWNPPTSVGGSGSITELGVVPGQTNQFSRSYAVNYFGQVVGESNNGPSKAFFWGGSGMSSLGGLAGDGSLDPNGNAIARAINDYDWVVGGSNGRAVIWDLQSSAILDLGSLDGKSDTPAVAVALNGAGDAAGYSRNTDNITTATLWQADGSLVELGRLQAGATSFATSLNASREVVGYAIAGTLPGSSTEMHRAFQWKSGVINNLGVLPTLEVAPHSRAEAINDLGWVVGYVSQYSGNSTLGSAAAVVWVDGQIFDLNRLLPAGSEWELLSATSINSHGDIVGVGRYQGSLQAYILSARPFGA